MIGTQHLLTIGVVLTVLWGIYLGATVRMYVATRRAPTRRREDVVVALRRVVVALCIWLVSAAYVVRSASVLLGLQNDLVTQVVVLTLVGSNVAGAIFAIVSLRYD